MHSVRNEFFSCLFKVQNVQIIQNDVIKCCKMMSSNVALLHSNNCCVLEPAICEDLDLHVVIYSNWIVISVNSSKWQFKSNKLVRKYTPFIEMKLVHGTLLPKSYMHWESRKHRGNSLIWNIGNWRHCQFCSNIFLFKV